MRWSAMGRQRNSTAQVFWKKTSRALSSVWYYPKLDIWHIWHIDRNSLYFCQRIPFLISKSLHSIVFFIVKTQRDVIYMSNVSNRILAAPSPSLHIMLIRRRKADHHQEYQIRCDTILNLTFDRFDTWIVIRFIILSTNSFFDFWRLFYMSNFSEWYQSI